MRLVVRSVDVEGRIKYVTYLELLRDNNGLPTTLDIDVVGFYAEAFDADGTLIGVGRTVTCYVNPDDLTAALYIAPPYSIESSPARLSSPRSDIGIRRLSDQYEVMMGVVLAGGRDVDGAPSDAIDIYDPCQHVVTTGTLPFRRAGITVMSQSSGSHAQPWYGTKEDEPNLPVRLFGGTDPAGQLTASFVEFNTRRSAPIGEFVDLGEQAGFERTGEREIIAWNSGGLITGTVPLQFWPDTGLSVLENVGPIPNNAIPAMPSPSLQVPQAVAFLQGSSIHFERPFGPSSFALPPGHERASLLMVGDRLVVIGGTETSVIFVDNYGSSITQQNVLHTPRFEPTLALSGEGGHLLVIGGVDGAGVPIPTAEIFKVGFQALTYVTSVPIIPRAHQRAIPVSDHEGSGVYDDYVLIMGGDEPSDAIEIFTPPNPF